MIDVTNIRKNLGRYISQPIVSILARTNLSPNVLSVAGLLVTSGAAVLIAMGHLIAAGFTVLAAGAFDILDGALARYSNRVTLFGGIFDSTIDRLSDAVLLLGVLGLLLRAPEQSSLFVWLDCDWAILLLFATLVSSSLVSYMRARAEAAGLTCQVGIFTRTERIIVLVLGLFLNQIVIALIIIALLSFITAGQRFVHIRRQTEEHTGR